MSRPCWPWRERCGMPSRGRPSHHTPPLQKTAYRRQTKMIELVLLLFLGVLLIAIVAALRARSAQVWRSELVAYSLRFPQGLEVARVAAFFNGLSGLVGTRWRRTVEMRAVALELVATSDGIHHY